MSVRHILAVLSATVILSAHAGLQSGHFAETSGMATGRWIKIAVDSCGVYQISHRLLAELGFDNPAEVSVRGFGATLLSDNNFSESLPDDLPPARFMHTPDGRLLFYGEGAVSVRADDDGIVTVRRNSHDTKGYYFLCDIPAEAVAEFDDDRRYAVDYIEYEAVNPGRGGAIYHDIQLSDAARVYNFNISGSFEGTVTLHYEFAAKSDKPFAPEVTLPDGWKTERETVNRTEPTSLENRLYTSGYGEIEVSDIGGDGQYAIDFALPRGMTLGYAAIDRAWLVYPCRQDCRTEKFMSPEIIGAIANQNLHAQPTPEMVIITTGNLTDAAEELAEIHRRLDGMDVRVVTQDEIFNEFSSGCRSAMAIRLYLKMLLHKQPKKLRHVIMYGRSEWDRQTAVRRGSLICYETENVEDASDHNRNYVSDKYFVMLEDDFDSRRTPFGKMSVNVGRIDANTVEEGRMINAKIKAHIEKSQQSNVYGYIVAASDSGDGGMHMTDVENKIALMLGYNPRLMFRKVHSSVYRTTRNPEPDCRKAMADALKSGCGLMVYCGHTGPRAFGSEGLYDAAFVKQVKYDDVPFALISSCETFGFDRNSAEMAQTMLKADRGGAIGVIGAGRPVYMELNRSMADAIVERYALAGPATTIGDIVREAHNYCIMAYKDEARATNAMCYNLCGDPALKLGAPEARINIATECEGSSVRVSGNMGSRKDFNGKATVRLCHAPVSVMSRDGLTVDVDEVIAGEWSANVSEGHFDTRLMLPAESEGNEKYRIYVSAISEDGKVRAIGKGEFSSSATDTMEPDISVPIIESLTVEDVAPRGREVSGRITRVRAVIESYNGLALGALGAKPVIIIDGNKRISPQVKAIGRGRYAIECETEGLTAGRHELTLTVRSQNGHSVSRTTEFIAGESRVDCRLSTESRIVRDEAVIKLSHNFSDSPTARIIIEDCRGRTVLSTDDCVFPFVWNLRDSNGRRVADGRYYVYALLRDSFDRTSTGKLEIIAVE